MIFMCVMEVIFNQPPWQILKFDENGEKTMKFYINEQLSWPQDIVFIEDQNVVSHFEPKYRENYKVSYG